MLADFLLLSVCSCEVTLLLAFNLKCYGDRPKLVPPNAPILCALAVWDIAELSLPPGDLTLEASIWEALPVSLRTPLLAGLAQAWSLEPIKPPNVCFLP